MNWQRAFNRRAVGFDARSHFRLGRDQRKPWDAVPASLCDPIGDRHQIAGSLGQIIHQGMRYQRGEQLCQGSAVAGCIGYVADVEKMASHERHHTVPAPSPAQWGLLDA